MKKKIVKKQKKKQKKSPTRAFSIRSAEDVPSDAELFVTKRHFDAFRQELSTRVTSIELLVKASEKKMTARLMKMEERFEARFAAIDARFAAIDTRFITIVVRFAEIDARFATMEKKIEDMHADIRRTNLLVEEQNNRNKLVMDALINLFNRQDSLEKKVDERIKTLEDTIKVGRA